MKSPIPQKNWKCVEQAQNETIAVVIDGPYEGMEIACDWEQGNQTRPSTKKERFLSIIRDASLVKSHMKIFDDERESN